VTEIATVVFFSFGMLWVAVPMGLIFGLHPLLVAAIAIPCSIAGASIVILIVNPLRNWVRRHYSERNRRGQVRTIFKVWRRFGIPGLGILGPLLVGPPPTVAIGLLLGADTRSLILWTSAGIVTWTAFMEILWWLGRDVFLALLA